MTPNAERLKNYKSKMSQAGFNDCPYTFALNQYAAQRPAEAGWTGK